MPCIPVYEELCARAHVHVSMIYDLGGIAGVIVSLWLAWAPVQRVLQDMKDEVKDAQLHGTVLTKSQVATNLALIALFWLCMTSIITILVRNSLLE